jgi:hypothetical protein
MEEYLYRFDFFNDAFPPKLVLRRYPVQRVTKFGGKWVIVSNYDELDPVTGEISHVDSAAEVLFGDGPSYVEDDFSFKRMSRRHKKLVFSHHKKQWACETVEKALASFVWRKKKQLERAERWADLAARALQLVSEMDDKYSQVANDRAQLALKRSGTFLDD